MFYWKFGLFQIRIVFLYWLPCLLRMSRPDNPEAHPPKNLQADAEMRERSSKSLLANVLDIDDDFRNNHRGPYYRTIYRCVIKTNIIDYSTINIV